jgi:MraZ protein
MFIGEYKHNLDEKGRLAVPAKFRDKLKDGAVVTKGLDKDKCLFLYAKDEWGKIAQKFADLPISQSKARASARHFLAGAMDVDFDGQGRINLPDYLCEFAKLKKKVIIAGLYNRLEIWDEAAWNKFKMATEKNSSEIAEALGELGV